MAWMRPRTWWVPAAVLGIFFLYPLGTVALHSGAAGAWEWANSSFVRRTLMLAIVQATLSTVLAVALGGALAWHHHRREVPFGHVQLAIHSLPFALPVFVVVFGLQATLGPILPGIGRALAAPLGLDPQLAGPMGAVVLAHAYYNYGLAARLIHAALERRPRMLEQAAATLGASPASTTWRVTWPLLAPAVGATALLVFLFSFGAFGTVLYLGDGQVRTLETVIYGYLGIFAEPGRAAVLGLLQLGLNAILLGCYLLLRRGDLRLKAEPPPRPRRRGGWWSWTAAALSLAPIAAVLVGGFRLRGEWSLEPWHNLMQQPNGFDLGAVLARTLLYAVGATLLAVALTFALAPGRRRSARRSRLAEAVASLPLAQSSLLAGLGFLLAFAAGTWLPLADTPWIILAAHTMVAFPFVARTLLPALEAHDVRLDEAALLLGAPPGQVLLRLQWPLLRRPITVAALTAAALSLGDFGASSLLSNVHTRPLVAWIAVLDAGFNPLHHARALLLTGILALMTLVTVAVAETAARRPS